MEDLSKFDDLIAEANTCYSLDLYYGVNITRHANSILHKKATWALRLEYRELAGKNVRDPVGWNLEDVVEVLRAH